MTDPPPLDPAAYVDAVAPAVGLVLDEVQRRAVAEAFALILRIAAPALDCAVPGQAEPAPVFNP